MTDPIEVMATAINDTEGCTSSKAAFWYPHVHAAISALDAAGYAIVPKIPIVEAIDASAKAEHCHFYGDKNPTSHTWRSTPRMLIVKMYRAMVEAGAVKP